MYEDIHHDTQQPRPSTSTSTTSASTPMRALRVYADTASARSAAVDFAIAVWLHAKFQKSQSRKTQATYSAMLQEFRDVVQAEGVDLDAADPRRLREVLRAHDEMHAADTENAVDAQQRLEDWTEERASALALLAQAYAARPARSRYGERPVAATTANLRLAVASSFYTYALRHRLLHGPNPITLVERRTVQAYAAARPLAYEDLRELLARLDTTIPAGRRDYALLLVGLHTGRRLSELAGMRREHLRIRKNAVEITWPRCKGGKVMRDELPRGGAKGIAADALVDWVLFIEQEQGVATSDGDSAVVRGQRAGPPPERPIWVSLAWNGTRGHPLSLRAIATICERHLGTSKVHALRHTFARGLEDAGAKVSEIQARLGHEDLSTTGRYLAQLHQSENKHMGRLSALYGLAPRPAPDEERVREVSLPPVTGGEGT